MEIAQKLGNRPTPLRIGPIALDGRAMLAPMSGISDLAMRRIARRFGASLVFSEMVAADAFLDGGREANLRAEGEGVTPHAVQLVGCDASVMAETARRVEAAGAAIVDINMGCPARRVAGRLAGSALMRDLDEATRLISAVVGAVKVPVSVKMRLGWDEDSRNAPDLARRAEQAGVAMIAIHARTRAQFYAGRPDWGAARAVVAATALPVVINGDCASLADAKAMLAASGAAGVMVGRAAIGAPWRVGAIARGLEGETAAVGPGVEERSAAACEHLGFLVEQLGPRAGLRHARKHLAAYAEAAGAPAPLRHSLVTEENPARAEALLLEAFGFGVEEAA